MTDWWDAVVVGAGPAGSATALCLARAGARVALVERRRFPRDKACGDLVGPRGVRLLDELGVDVPGGRRMGDMVLFGPSGRRALLPALPGLEYPDHAIGVPRLALDAALFEAAVGAGACPVHDRAVGLTGDMQAPDGVRLAGGGQLRAGVVVGADGAVSRVADAAGLVDADRVLWGFAVRRYFDVPVRLPQILLWEPERWRPFPGYGWVFPTADGRANVGLGVAVGADRQLVRQAGARFAEFCGYLAGIGLLPRDARAAEPMLGGWLKMGMVGTTPARGTALLVGDAAGLINPLQGEGIGPALRSAQAAAAAITADGPVRAAAAYRDAVRVIGAHHRANAPVQAAVVRHPRAVSVAGRVLTTPPASTLLAGGWSLYWNDLVRGARPSRHRLVAGGMARLVGALS